MLCQQHESNNTNTSMQTAKSQSAKFSAQPENARVRAMRNAAAWRNSKKGARVACEVRTGGAAAACALRFESWCTANPLQQLPEPWAL